MVYRNIKFVGVKILEYINRKKIALKQAIPTIVCMPLPTLNLRHWS